MNCSGGHLVRDTIEFWHSISSGFPSFGCRYSPREQQEREELLDECLDRIEQELRRVPGTGAEAEMTVTRLTTSAVELATCALGICDSYVDSLLREGFSEVGVELARSARQIDPEVSMADVLQACRNAWTAGALQLLFGREIQLTPAIFAYSMLYPYSDNYLDDAAVSTGAKLRFSERFRERLAGKSVPADSEREGTIWQLVGLIESQYPRNSYPGVYDSLLAIHSAQQDSIAQLRKGGGEAFPVLKLSLTKGGTSVLADAYLVAGTLTEKQANFAFNWGVLLQLSDDLQDLREDSRAGSVTVFSKAVKCCEPLDEMTNRTFHFGQSVMSETESLAGGSSILKRLLTASSQSLMMRSVACAAEYYTDGYLTELETYSPLRFGFLRSRERRLTKRQKTILRLFQIFTSRTPQGVTNNPVSGVSRNDRTLTRISLQG